MKNKTDKEIREFYKLFTDKSSLPDPRFRKKLKKRIIKEYHQKPTFFGFRFSFLSLFALSLLIGIFIFSNLPIIDSNNQNTVSLSNGKKKEVLDNVLKNNDSILLKQMEEGIEQVVANENIVAQALSIEPEPSNISKFFQNSITTKQGERYSECYGSQLIAANSEYFSYKDNERSYIKTVTYDSQGSVQSYMLVKRNSDNIEVIFFDGIKAARIEKIIVKEDSPISFPASFPVSFPVENENNSQFNEANVVAKKIEDKEYFVIVVEKQSKCQASELSPTLNLVINPESFEVERTEEYIGEANETNLVYSIQNLKKEQIEGLNFNEVEDIFKFEFNFKIENIEISELSEFFGEEGQVKGVLSYPIDLLEGI